MTEGAATTPDFRSINAPSARSWSCNSQEQARVALFHSRSFVYVRARSGKRRETKCMGWSVSTPRRGEGKEEKGRYCTRCYGPFGEPDLRVRAGCMIGVLSSLHLPFSLICNLLPVQSTSLPSNPPLHKLCYKHLHPSLHHPQTSTHTLALPSKASLLTLLQCYDEAQGHDTASHQSLPNYSITSPVKLKRTNPAHLTLSSTSS